MPNHTNPTLALALGLDGGPMREQLGKVAKDCIELDIKQQIGTALTPGFWNGVGQEVEEAVVKGLDDIPISKILVEAWLSAMQFRSYADPEIHPAGEPSVATLAKHSVKSPHKVSVDLLVAGHTAKSLVLDLVVLLDLDGVHLRILDGRIRAISLGATKVSASLKLAGKEVKRFPLREFRYDGELELHPPMPIMLPDRYPPAVALPEEARVPTPLAPPSSG
jgi:hypothetical protein